jgi:hypothetical protein
MGSQQFAFVPGPGKGTASALTLFSDRILLHLDKPGAFLVILLDYSKAFDSVKHNGILAALIRLKAPREAILSICSYLEGRYQRVISGDQVSEWTEVLRGVPQGRVLGPFLFAALTGNLRLHSANVTYIKYADDILSSSQSGTWRTTAQTPNWTTLFNGQLLSL